MAARNLFESLVVHVAMVVWVLSPAAGAVTLTPDEAAERAVRNNPSLAAARFRIVEERGRLEARAAAERARQQVTAVAAEIRGETATARNEMANKSSRRGK